MKRVEDWKSRLIDLSRKNNLLYFQRSKRSNLAVTHPEAQKIFDALVLKKKRLEFWHPPDETNPEMSEAQKDNGKGRTRTIQTQDKTETTDTEVAIKEERKCPLSNELVCGDLNRMELERTLKSLERRSLLDYRERGVRILHAAFGTLKWVDAETNENVQSPLVLVPLELKRETIRAPFSIVMPPIEDEVVLNPALLVKLKNEYKIDLPALPENWEGQKLADYFNLVNKSVENFGWEVEASIDLGLFSFQKLVIYKDLESNAEVVTQHPIIRAISGIKEDDLILSGLPDEKDVDKIEEPAKTYQVLDADSSQRVSIEYALRGQSFVMKGPPGTGKSQTIANIIAECIANGKSVLFVSDKMAALEVVYKRLREVGLSHFCLELHSSKANKQQVVTELKRSLDETIVPRKLPSAHDFERVVEYREVLNGYVSALHEQRPFLQKTVYEVLSIVASLERIPFVSVGLADISTLTPQKMREIEELVSQLSKVWQVVEEPDFPWFGYYADKYNLEVRSELLSTLEAINETISALKLETESLSAKIGVYPPETFSKISWLLDVTKLLSESPEPESHWLTNPNLEKVLIEAKNYRDICHWIITTRTNLMERYDPSLFTLSLNKAIEIYESLSALKKVLPTINLEESDLLAKREKFSSFVKNTQISARKWRETSQALAALLGLDNYEITIQKLRQLSRMALLVFAVDKPEPQWFDAKYLEQVQETVEKAKQLYQDYNLLKSRLEETYSEEFFDLNLDELIANYSGPYQSSLKVFNSNYRNDQKKIAKITLNGRVPKTILQDLIDARRVKKIQDKIEKEAETTRILLGHYYNKTRTDFQGAEKAIALTDEVKKLSWAATIPDILLKLLTTSTSPSPMIRNLGLEIQDSITKWEQQSIEVESLIPSKVPKSEESIMQTPLQQLEDWATEIERHLIPLCNQTRDVIAASKMEPENYKQLIQDLKDTEEVLKKEAQIVGEKLLLQEKYGRRFQGLETSWEDIIAVLEWCKKVQSAFIDVPVPQVFAEIAAQGSKAAPSETALINSRDASLKVLSDLERRFDRELNFQNQRLKDLKIQVIGKRIQAFRDRVDDLQIWIDFIDVKNHFTLRSLESFFNRLVEQKVSADDLLSVFRHGVYQEWINAIYEEDLRLGKFRRENHEQLIADFRRLDQDVIRLTSSMVIEAVNSRKPQDILIQAADTEAGILSKEAAKKRLLLPIRVLFQKIPNLLVKLKPCLLMSPISVSQFLPPGAKFDLVLFDEASQIVPEDAIGAIYRGKTSVIAGDNKQLPPTSFFQKSLFDDIDWDVLSDDDVEVCDSILDECLGIGLPVKTLRWHYRSKHEDLIAFSNNRFYDDTMITFPSAECQTENLGVKHVYVQNGVYDRGCTRSNLVEAEKVVDLVFEHFIAFPEKTLGVVTFSIVQMNAVEEIVERRLKEHPEFEHFFKEDRLGGFFVKNLENVQGDERDVIFFSIGYGFDQQGQITMNFGPLNKPGGERRLNVAVTRAREKVVLITSIKSSDIDPDTKALGVQTLRAYLDYAEHGPETLDTLSLTGEFDSAIDEDVSAEIKKLGYEIVPQVGCSGFKIDVGVVDPVNKGCFLMGVECDGTTYRSSSSARDRDRLREQVLGQLGWHIHRIWSPTWVARRDSEIRRLREALELTQKQQIEKEIQKPMIDCERELMAETDVQRNTYAGIEKIGIPYKVYPLKATFNPYIQAAMAQNTVDTKVRNEFHFPENRENQTRLLAELIANEGPVHFDYAVERLARAWSIRRVNPKIAHAVKESLNALIRERKVDLRGSFLWPAGLKETSIRVPIRGVPESKRKPQYIAPEEIESAMKVVAQYALGISEDSLISETARVFGVHLKSEGAKKVFSEALKRLIRDRELLCKDKVVSVL
jgi:hypothetical protein